MNNINNCKSAHLHTPHTHTRTQTLTRRHTHNRTRMQSGVNRCVCCILKGAARANKSVELQLCLPSFRSKINGQWTKSYSKSAANANSHLWHPQQQSVATHLITYLLQSINAARIINEPPQPQPRHSNHSTNCRNTLNRH